MNSRHAQLSARRVVRAQAGPAPPVGGAQERHHDGRAAVGTVCSGMRTRNGTSTCREFLLVLVPVLGQTASWMHSEAERIQPESPTGSTRSRCWMARVGETRVLKYWNSVSFRFTY
jgi:hypothetical protein